MNEPVVKRVEFIRDQLKITIKNFDKFTADDNHFWFSLDTSPSAIQNDMFFFQHLRKNLLIELLDIYTNWGVITVSQKESLMSQLNSVDSEAWYLAFVLINNIKPYKVKKK